MMKKLKPMTASPKTELLSALAWVRTFRGELSMLDTEQRAYADQEEREILALLSKTEA
jgi:hypothetical protein